MKLTKLLPLSEGFDNAFADKWSEDLFNRLVIDWPVKMFTSMETRAIEKWTMKLKQTGKIPESQLKGLSTYAFSVLSYGQTSDRYKLLIKSKLLYLMNLK